MHINVSGKGDVALLFIVALVRDTQMYRVINVTAHGAHRHPCAVEYGIKL